MIRNMIEPTSKEIKMKADDMIVSKTDLKGKIIYCNDTFMKVSGFYEEELLQQPHNIIRHPDMPHSVFRLMWEYLKNGEEFIGLMKNLCKDGSYYWTLATIMHNFDLDEKEIGYMSVRRCPSRSAIESIEPLYKEMHSIESQYDNKRQGMDASYQVLEKAVSVKGGYNEFICSYL